MRGFKVAYRINGKLVSPTEGLLNALMLLYADDLVLLAPDSRSLEAALLVLDQVARKWAMSVNYAFPEAQRARRAHLENILTILAWIATVDAFQHWVYTHPNHTRTDRAGAWVALLQRFGGDVDWTGYEPARAYLWHRQLHIFTHPFYYIEYGIAQLGALQVWANARRDRPGALRNYKAALALGGSRPLPELFAAAGCAFDFSRKTIAPLVRLLLDELTSLPVN